MITSLTVLYEAIRPYYGLWFSCTVSLLGDSVAEWLACWT